MALDPWYFRALPIVLLRGICYLMLQSKRVCRHICHMQQGHGTCREASNACENCKTFKQSA